jgi:hypothetical protein
MTSSMTLFLFKIISMADSFDYISTNIGGRSKHEIVQKIYTTNFDQHVCFTIDTVIAVKNTFDLCGFDAQGRRPTDEYADKKPHSQC